MRRPALIAFLGPSLSAREAARVAPGCQVLPPARQGDLWRALALRPRVLALIDGTFGHVPSVWHHELLDALEAGVAVFGGASMGALRAAELSAHGMVGVGRIFEAYRDGRLTGDDEVALLHGPAELQFRPLTTPLVDVRAASERGLEEGALSARQARALVRAASDLHYMERTWPRVLEAARPALGGTAHSWLTALVASRRPDPKGEDARATLAAASAFARSNAPVLGRPVRRPSSLVRRRKLSEATTVTREGICGSGAVLAALAAAPDAGALRDQGLRRALLAEMARALGLRTTEDERRAALAEWLASCGASGQGERFLAASGLDGADALRLADDLALEGHLLRRAAEVVSDGPSDDEGLALGARLAGRWAVEAKREIGSWGRKKAPSERSKRLRPSRSTRRSRGSRIGSE